MCTSNLNWNNWNWNACIAMRRKIHALLGFCLYGRSGKCRTFAAEIYNNE